MRYSAKIARTLRHIWNVGSEHVQSDKVAVNVKCNTLRWTSTGTIIRG